MQIFLGKSKKYTFNSILLTIVEVGDISNAESLNSLDFCQISGHLFVFRIKQTLHKSFSKMTVLWVSGRDVWGISVLLLLSLTYCESSVQQDDALSTAVMHGFALSHLRWPVEFLSKTVHLIFY